MEVMNYLNKFGSERAEGDTIEDWASAVLKISCLLLIGFVLINSVAETANIGAAAIIHFL